MTYGGSRLQVGLVAILIGVTNIPVSKAEQTASQAPRALSCEFNVVQSGQFRGSRYVGSPAKGGLVLTLVASAVDARAGRAVLIDGERAAVVALIVQPHQTLFIDSKADDASVVTIFTAARESAEIPAAYSRQLMFGTIPIVSQYTGLCRPQ